MAIWFDPDVDPESWRISDIVFIHVVISMSLRVKNTRIDIGGKARSIPECGRQAPLK
jgi:hypothetical protein